MILYLYRCSNNGFLLTDNKRSYYVDFDSFIIRATAFFKQENGWPSIMEDSTDRTELLFTFELNSIDDLYINYPELCL